ncbi:MAG: methyltransferase domain-containing protein [Actinomycetota bacterium]
MDASALREHPVNGRQWLVWRLLADALATLPLPARVLDCGGGSGSIAVPIARTGAHVTVVDISPDALSTLHRRAEEAGVAALVRPVQGDVEALDDLVARASVDLGLAHGILEVVDQPEVALAAIVRAVRPGGLVSVLVANPAAGVLARALAGDLTGAIAELRALDRPGRQLRGVGDVVALCTNTGLLVEQVHGVGVFAELIPGAVLDARPGGVEALAELEQAAAQRGPFRDIAGRLHLLCRRAVTPSGPG